MNANKRTFTFIWGILYIFSFSTNCTAQVQNSNSEVKHLVLDTIPPSIPEATEKDSTPFRFLSYEVQQKLRPQEPYHDYGGVRLTLSGGYYSLRDGVSEIIHEIHPGILLYKRKGGEKGSTYWKIEFYDVQSKKLIQAINLEENTPYNKTRYSNIEFGLYGGEDAGHQSPPLPDSNCVYAKLPKPNTYLTNTYVSASPGGHVCVRYELYSLWDSLFVGFENTCVIYDKKGRKKWEMTLPNNLSSPYITDDGKYLAYIYGTHTSDNFHDACQGNIKILDLKTNETIFHYVFGKDEKITTMFEAEKNGQLIVQSRNVVDGMYVNKIVILDPNTLGIFERTFTKEEWNNVVKNWTSYEHLKKQYSFKFKKI